MQQVLANKVNMNRLILLVVSAAAAVAMIVAVGFANAAPAGKPTKEQCAAAGFRNYGQCVSQWAHTKGYGNDH
jgi:hypothetical protein